MSEPTEPPTEPAAEPQEQPPIAEPARRWHLLPWLTGVGFVVVAGALIWLWQHPFVPSVSTEQTDALARQLGALEARASRLEQQPPAQVADLGPLTARVSALEHRPPADAAAAPPPDLAPLERRVAVLEQRQPPNLAPLEARIAAVQTDLSQRIEAEQTRLRRMTMVQVVGLALAAGQKLGDLPGAPTTLARFADAPPPTEAALRLAFPAAAREALAASHPPTEGKPLLTRLWAQAQDLVTVRQGDTVLVGDPAAGVLERARAALDAGDLAAAVTAVATLQGAAAQAMAPWLAQARELLEARAALAAWAASG
jgi:hypothetical protein